MTELALLRAAINLLSPRRFVTDETQEAVAYARRLLGEDYRVFCSDEENAMLCLMAMWVTLDE